MTQSLLDAIAAMPLHGDAQRIFHGRGDRFPDSRAWTLDVFPPVFVLTCFAPASGEDLARIGTALQARWQQIAPGQPLNWVFQQRGTGRADTRLMAGNVPEPQVVTEDGARYRVNVPQGQNHGLFLDMAAGRRWVRAHVAAHRARTGQGARVLNLFAYTCAFSVVALQAGARQVVNIDMARGAMATGQHNHRLNGLDGGAAFLVHDLFSSWGKVTRGGPYDLVIADPPSYQKGSFVATKDYARVLRRLPGLLAPGGHALLCLNAPELGEGFVRGLVDDLAPPLALVERVANPAVFADVDEERSLKVLAFRCTGAAPQSGGTSPSSPSARGNP